MGMNMLDYTGRGSLVFSCIGLMLVFLLTPATARGDESVADAARVLERFAGEWTTETKIRHAGPPREIATRGTAECRPTLEGRYYEFRSKTVPAGQAELQLMTYDNDDGVYRQWVFSSDGYTHEATGQWDAARSTLRWEGKSGARTFVIDDRWVSPDRLEWTLQRRDAAGKVVQTIEGVVKRVKDSVTGGEQRSGKN